MSSAIRWWKDGDHPAVKPAAQTDDRCSRCGRKSRDHGGLSSSSGGFGYGSFTWVCPGDYIHATPDGFIVERKGPGRIEWPDGVPCEGVRFTGAAAVASSHALGRASKLDTGKAGDE